MCMGDLMIRKDTNIFKKEVKEKYGDEYSVLGEYTKNNEKILMKHNKCGNVYDIRPTHLLHRARCRYCSDKFKKDKDWINNRLKEIGSDVIVLEEVHGVNKKVKCKCSKGHEFLSYPTNLTKGIGCPRCSSSKGEKEIKRILSETGIEFIQQYRFEKCVNKRTLPFDFYLPKQNICIEYDGEQHFSPYKFTKKYENFINIKRNDKIKDEFCKNNSIKLIRIPYYDFENIETILKTTLK